MSERIYRTTAMFTDHDFYGHPVETTRVTTYISDLVEWTPEMLAALDHQQEMTLHYHAKNMPHQYWRDAPSFWRIGADPEAAMQRDIEDAKLAGYSVRAAKGQSQ